MMSSFFQPLYVVDRDVRDVNDAMDLIGRLHFMYDKNDMYDYHYDIIEYDTDSYKIHVEVYVDLDKVVERITSKKRTGEL